MRNANNTNAFFGTQTHCMSDELLNAMDMMVWSPGAPEWFQEFFAGVEVDEEFTVTAEQAQWILEEASSRYHHPEASENNWEDDFALINETFDDFTCFLRMLQSGGDALRIVAIPRS
jgi:hypothetical protein